ncbi:MAG: ComEC/Rec2 family competence protein, partial [Gemmatimonadaceae bacterium]
MPLAALAFCAYAAGLALGFGGAIVWGTVVLAGAGVAAWSAKRHPWPLLAATAIAGVIAANAAMHADERCLDSMRSAGHATVQLRSPLAPGRAARALYEGDECRVSMRVRGGRTLVPAGTLISAQGSVARSSGGAELRAERVTIVARAGRIDRWRTAVGERVDALFGPDAPLARALLLADADDVDRALRDRFADAGIVHMLSVSGLHVAIIANALRTGALAAGLSAIAAEGVALGTAVLFVLFIGAPPPAARSVVMLVLVAVSRRVQRPTAVWGVWGVSSAVSLVDPRVVLDLGWQLSVTGMAGLLASAPLARRWCSGMRGWRRSLADGVLATTVASLATAPLVAWVFGRVSLVALVTNLVAAPLFEITQPLLFATVLVSPMGVLARLLADAGRSSLWMVDLVARAGAAVPMGVINVQPALPTTVCLAVSAAALVVAAAGRWPRRPLAVALGAGVLACWWPTLVPGSGQLELHMLDVGQGDALALRTPRGRWILVDAGGAWNGGDAAKSVVLPYLRKRGGEIVLLATSHPHADHIG